jgi:drug/metabolite transporter (DMT)-like permease
VVTVTVLPVALLTMNHPADALKACASIPAFFILVWLTLASTLASFCLMNYWQPRISSTHASLIYCSEPLFTSVIALFVPAMISSAAGINYPNECLTQRLLLGGGLITAANALVFWHASRQPAPEPRGKPLASVSSSANL